MKRLAMLVCVGLAGCTSGQVTGLLPAAGAFEGDLAGAWPIFRSQEAGMSVALPCEPTLSSSTPLDGAAHPVQEVALHCAKSLGEGDKAFFRVTRMSYAADHALARPDFDRYMTYARPGQPGAPKVQLIGQAPTRHSDYTLKQEKVAGDLGFISMPDSCMWNFFGLGNGYQIQAIMTLPKAMCPQGAEPVLTKIAAKYFDSIRVEDR